MNKNLKNKIISDNFKVTNEVLKLFVKLNICKIENETLALTLKPHIFLLFSDFNPKDKKLSLIVVDRQINHLICFERNKNKLSIFDLDKINSKKDEFEAHIIEKTQFTYQLIFKNKKLFFLLEVQCLSFLRF